MSSRSLWRDLSYESLSGVALSGSVLDLGGSHRSKYHSLIKGDPTFKVANLDNGEHNDFSFDFEQQFPIESSSFDGVLCVNVLEHIFNYQNVLRESYRILKPGGSLVIVVPFLIQVHRSPNDHWRYTDTTLERICHNAGFKTVEVNPIGTGVFGASYSMRHNLYRFAVVQRVLKTLAVAGDWLLSIIKKNSHFSKEYYPLGYLVMVKK